MDAFTQVGGYIVNTDMLITSVLCMMAVSVILAVIYYQLDQPVQSVGYLSYKENNSGYTPQHPVKDSSSSYANNSDGVSEYQGQSFSSDTMQLAFCPNGCAVINAHTKEVIAKYNAGSMNCRLLVYLFSRPDQYLTEQEIVRSINPDKPENFYIRKAVCNLKLDKELRSKIFTFQNANTVRLNTTITLQKKSCITNFNTGQ